MTSVFGQLSSELDLPERLPWGKLYLHTTEVGVSSTFLTLSFVCWGLTQPTTKVVLVGMNEPYSHYFITARKKGFNLSKLADEGRFVFVDTFSSGGEEFSAPIPSVFRHPNPPAPPFPTFAFGDRRGDPEASLRGLVSLLRDQCSKPLSPSPSPSPEDGGTPGVLVVFDNLDVVMDMGAQPFHVNSLLSAVRSLSVQNTVIATASSDVPEYKPLIAQLSHVSDVVLNVSCLRTGTARDVTGQIDSLVRTINGAVRTKKLHYKLSDNNVKFFTPGTSLEFKV